jgi:heparanase 1
MRHNSWCGLSFLALVALQVAPASLAQEKPTVKLDPAKMPKLGTVDPGYLSYNVEMVEVTGGRFWKPYASQSAEGASAPAAAANQQVGDNAALFQYRPPIDLSNGRLRKLAAALGPAYVRVSGSWANSTYFQDDDRPAQAKPPEGFRSVLTRAEWKGVIDFAHAANAQIVTSVAISPGSRNAEGVWSPEQAKALFDYTASTGGKIAATEFMNEPTIPGPGGAPKGYDAQAYARDAKVFAKFLRKQSPETVFLGPGGVGEGSSLLPAGMQMNLIKSEDILKDTGPLFDAFSYHFYGAVSHRCAGKVTVDQALSADWLDRTDLAEGFYAKLRDTYLPGKPMWLTETAEAACGGDPFAGQFVDVFRFLNQLGTLAQRGVKVVMHNTLASSDYGLLSEDTLQPRPDYWAALLWKRTMGSTVLNPLATADPSVRIYAQCTKGKHGGVTLLAMNTDPARGHAIALATPAERFTLTSNALTSTSVLLNGMQLQARGDGSLPSIQGRHVSPGTLELAPLSVTFLTIPSTANPNCTKQ